MNRQIRRLGVAMLVIYTALFIQLNIVQVIKADEYADNPANRREILRDFGKPRGQIIAADGQVIASSKPDGGSYPFKREYPAGDLFAHVTGYYSFSFGSEGVERFYNDDLAGRTGTVTAEGIANLLIDEERTADVTLTISPAVQQAAKDALGTRKGSVVAIDPRTGALLALWSYPSFDPNAVSSNDQAAATKTRAALLADPSNPLLAHTYRETYFPGSTFKIVTAASGLSSGKITPEEPVYPETKTFVPPLTNVPIRNFNNSTCGGALFQILQVSCNTAFAQMGVELGAETLVTTSQNFGFGETPPIDLPNATPATIASIESFDRNTPVLAQTAIGQNSVRSTPLQMALVASAIANSGVIMVPHVMSEIRDNDARLIDQYEPRPWRTAIKPEVASVLRDAMVNIVQRGTATRLVVPGVTTAGKTGTAQIGNGLSHAWIIGFAPAEAPRVAIAVIVDGQEGASEQTGGRVAAPIGQAVLTAALAETQ